MPRKKRSVKREIKADSKYNSMIIAKLINCIMYQGRKSAAESIVYGALDFIDKKGKNSMDVFKTAIENIKPIMELKSRRIGGANYQIPVEVNTDRRQSLAIRWLINATRERKEKSMIERLALELLAAEQNQGGAIKKKEDTHKMAEANKAFAHYRW
ncbi:MAG: 30S ribosomal protein S7 [Candidatus Aerophobetes bacterium ADurb.Bin490]|nr:MAG: 30S ribosomal protein S7 [Candidatus Aerophobetes bacterium ADurb.Bin490]HPI03894.1 30S ribosomal protein S7 [Candidatus Goldiibacteriota bacterium]HPN64518.1 30S ribosomal protein S7 [Candidatus Goldiibacteriota bacterium]HRQ42979.1 30S ribosomal protein S7 [Candidatus Goldiibacteriota bacterium]